MFNLNQNHNGCCHHPEQPGQPAPNPGNMGFTSIPMPPAASLPLYAYRAENAAKQAEAAAKAAEDAAKTAAENAAQEIDKVVTAIGGAVTNVDINEAGELVVKQANGNTKTLVLPSPIEVVFDEDAGK